MPGTALKDAIKAFEEKSGLVAAEAEKVRLGWVNARQHGVRAIA